MGVNALRSLWSCIVEETKSGELEALQEVLYT